MKTIIQLALSICLIFAMSCTAESVDDPAVDELTATNVRAGKKITKPVKNSYTGVDRADGTGQDFTGTMSHVGKFTGSTFITSFVFNPDGTATLTSDDVIVAANGDEIYTSSEVILVFGNPAGTEGTYSGGFDITGGTGRFDGATGRMTMDNGVFKDGVATHNAVGEITY